MVLVFLPPLGVGINFGSSMPESVSHFNLNHILCFPWVDGHFDHVSKLTKDNFEDTVKMNVDAGKTMFVRWIASEG